MPIWLDVNPHNGIPLYVQIVEQVKHALGVGILRPGDALPTVRQLASELTIAPNTIVKAYNELQRLGLIVSRPGIGTVVSALPDTLVQQQQAAIFERLAQVVRDALSLGVSPEQLHEALHQTIDDLHKEKP